MSVSSNIILSSQYCTGHAGPLPRVPDFFVKVERNRIEDRFDKRQYAADKQASGQHPGQRKGHREVNDRK